MDIDIDIEEHNILEDPALKAIFPDITALKQELEYENEDFISNPNVELGLPNTISNNNLNTALSGQENDFDGNKITLAGQSTKRCSTDDLKNDDVKLKKQAVISVPDINYTLRNSTKFCKYCLVLFPSSTSFVNHTEKVHKKTINNDRKLQKEVEILQTNQLGNIGIGKESVTNLTSQVLCFHCKSKFSSKKALIDHLFEVLEPQFNKQPDGKQTTNELTSTDVLERPQNKEMENESNVHQKNTNNESVESTISQTSKKELFYKCHVCSYYFKCEKFFNEHMFNNHEINDYTVSKVSFTPKCKFCSLHCYDIKSYNRHLYNIHKDNILKHKITRKNQTQISKKNDFSANIVGRDKARYFQCHLCFYYYIDEAFYKKHMLYKHRIQNPVTQKVSYNAKCRFCSIHYNNTKLYNSHIYKTHRKNIIQLENKPKPKFNKCSNSLKRPSNKKGRNDIVLPKSALFKCCKCDIVFISPSMAINHTEHMEMLINWKCDKCNLYFKENDSAKHLLQHNACENFTILEISADLLSKLLYSCPRCAVHFQVNKFFGHYSVCENETPQSAHCGVCDILIDHDIKTSHHAGHLKGNKKDTDFITIELFDDENIIKKQQECSSTKELMIEANADKTSVNSKNYHLHFCKTCKCFVSKGHKVYIHKKSQCSRLLKHACKFCGLVFTPSTIVGHRKIHSENKVTLQDFTFYNLCNGEEICPPIPELPKCNLCNIHVILKKDLKTHVCSVEYEKTCPFCKIILNTEAYEVHVPFHKYKIKKKTLNNTFDDKDISSGTKNEENVEQSDISIETTHEIGEQRSIPVAYCCKECSATIDTYDKVIYHCQMHLVSAVIPDTITHKKNNENTEVYIFDPFYYGAKNKTWHKHLYGVISQEKLNALLKNAIYKYESRVKMEINQEGCPDFTEYKCGKCNCLVDCLSIYEHISSCTKNGKKIVCTVCLLQLLTKDSLNKHLKYHAQLSVKQKSLRIVIFNKTEHKHINKLIKLNACKPYVVYKCRNCEGLINKPDILSHKCNPSSLKVCSDCGLSLYNKDYETHVMKHKQLTSFTENNIKVVLVGKKSLEHNESNIRKNSFIGVVCDYTFYKCSKCEVCIKDYRCTSKHFCLVDSAKAKCSKCGLFFDEGKLKFHLKFHLNDPEFVKDNILTISFDPSDYDEVKNIKAVRRKNDVISVDECDAKERRLAKLYKCVKCNLHFLTEANATEHVKKQPGRIKKQNCTKCGFTFSSDSLFNHLLEHHGKKNIAYDFEVIHVMGTFKKQKIFKCSICNLHFTNSRKMYDHQLKCLGDSSKGDKCKYCGVMFHFSYLLCHEKMHETNMHVDYEVETNENS